MSRMEEALRGTSCTQATVKEGVSNMKKLTKEQVDALRSEWTVGGVKQKELAEKYGISQSNVSHIVNGKTHQPKPEVVENPLEDEE